MNKNERQLLRDLAKRYRDIASAPIQNTRRNLWRRHNSLTPTRPPIFVRAFAWHEMPESACTLQDPFWCSYENFFRNRLFWSSLDDDSIFEPWITVAATHVCNGWGPEIHFHNPDEPHGAWKLDYAIKTISDLSALRVPWHEINETKTAEDLERVTEVLGDILPINLDRAPAYRMWEGDISTHLGHLRGIENIMMDMMDEPDSLKALCQFLSDGIERVHSQAEAKGDWALSAHENQAMPYAEELPDPAANSHGAKRNQLWGYMASQEFTAVSPDMQEEFLLTYQRPILDKFGLVAYGCCEDLTNKIAILRKIPNLRRIAVSPFANVPSCAERIGRDYVFSYRPSPADMVSYSYDEDRILGILRRDLQACRQCHVDITLKDVETVGNDPTRVKKWVRLTRQVITEIWG